MSNDAAKAKRVLHVKIRAPSPDAVKLLATMIKNAETMKIPRPHLSIFGIYRTEREIKLGSGP